MKNRSKQRGLAVIVFLALLTAAAAGMAVKAINNGNNQITQDQNTATALAQAKEALIGYAITYADNHLTTPPNVPGYLPCPDTAGSAEVGGEGAATGNCGSQNISVIGRLPWKTLRLPPLRGGDRECLWYAVSGTYKNNPKTAMMNWDTKGLLQVFASDGATQLTAADDQAVAVIFAPGSTTAGQDRAGTVAPVCGGNYTASNYLDATGAINNATVSSTANANSQFRLGDPTLTSGDKIAFITRKDLWDAMKRRQNFFATLDAMTSETAKCIAKFSTTNNIAANKSLPWPAQIALPSGDYVTNTNYNDHDGLLAGRVPYRVNTARGQTGNTISNPYYLLKNDGINCPVPATWTAVYPWWNNWKDNIFYAISDRYKPNNVATAACASGHCVSVNGSGLYAAVVIFASDRLAGQIRSNPSVISTYLEGLNAPNINGTNAGHGNYQAETATIPASATFNDIVYCIREDLSVVKGTTAGCP